MLDLVLRAGFGSPVASWCLLVGGISTNNENFFDIVEKLPLKTLFWNFLWKDL